MSDPIALRGSGWGWKPTWRWDFPAKGAEPVKVWSGNEILVDADGETLRRNSRGEIGRGIGFNDLIERQAPPPDRPVWTDEEMAEVRRKQQVRRFLTGEGGFN